MNPTTLPCSCCGYLLSFPESSALHVCPACGTPNACPRSTGDTLAVLERATRQRLAGDFASAETSYQQVLLINPDEHEALWGRLLCHYGVSYVEDPATGRRLPTVQNVRPRPMQEQQDFAAACEFAPEAVRSQYQQDAAYIDNAQSKIRQLAASQPSWDVFICNKTTLASGGYTQDHLYATRLYYHLKEQGLKVFFAPECLQATAGANYEAAIYHALHTVRVMLIICTEPEHLMSPWVHSEWSRFLGQMEEDDGRRLVPLLYGSFSPAALPAPFRYRRLQALNMSDVGANEALVTMLREVIQADEPAPEAAPQPASAPAPAAPAPASEAPAGGKGDVVFEYPRRIPEWRGNPRWKICLDNGKNTVLATMKWGKSELVQLDAANSVTVRRDRVSPLWPLWLILGTIVVFFVSGAITLPISAMGVIVTPVYAIWYICRIVGHHRRELSFTLRPGKRYRLYWAEGNKLAVEEL